MIALLTIIGPSVMVAGYLLVVYSFRDPAAHFRNQWNEDEYEDP